MLTRMGSLQSPAADTVADGTAAWIQPRGSVQTGWKSVSRVLRQRGASSHTVCWALARPAVPPGTMLTATRVPHRELEKQRESTASDILQKKQEAEAAVRLMQESVRRIIEAEESRMGLIIVNAWYGKFVNDRSRKNERVKVIDVTVPLQCLVKDSKLILTEASKAGLPGFYDPCVGEEKNLKVLYQFRGVLHQVMALDNEALRIPKQSHRIDTDG